MINTHASSVIHTMIIHTQTPARAGLIGNPSDGFHGVTIAFTFDAYSADVWLWESPELVIQQSRRDATEFASMSDLVSNVSNYGYYGGIRLIKAMIKVFADYCHEQHITLPERNFTIKYQSNIPVRVGLAGSSAIITSTFKALMQFYDVSIPQEIQPNLILKAETDELKIGAGLQDRVVQSYGGLVYMDFNRKHMQHGSGKYELLDARLLPSLYIAFHDSAAEGTEVAHNDLRERYERGDQLVIDTLDEIASLAKDFRKELEAITPENQAIQQAKLSALMNRNYELRSKICVISEFNQHLIQAAQTAGASAKFCGSGGAVIGIYEDDAMYLRLEEAYAKLGATLLKPKIVSLV